MLKWSDRLRFPSCFANPSTRLTIRHSYLFAFGICETVREARMEVNRESNIWTGDTNGPNQLCRFQTEEYNIHDARVECVENEILTRTRNGGIAVCADLRCMQDPGFYEIHYTENRIDIVGMVQVPALLKRCDKNTMKLVFTDNDTIEYRVVKEYTFAVSSLYDEVVLPSRLYVSVWNEQTKRSHAELIVPKSSNDLPLDLAGDNKLRVRSDEYGELLDFCRFSIHTHVRSNDTICCKRKCSRPEPLTKVELIEIKSVARNEPYYTCSWLEKQVLFKWNVGDERFEPFWTFELAVGLYNDAQNRLDARAFKLFGFQSWKCPDESVTNADRVYFQSPTNLGGYKWYEPTSLDDENTERYKPKTKYCGSGYDPISKQIATSVMNLVSLPDNVLLSSALIKQLTLDNGSRCVGL